MKPIHHIAIRLVPYLAVGIGLFVLESAWAALAGYHIGIMIALTMANQWRQAALLRPRGISPWLVMTALSGLFAGDAVFLYWNIFGLPAEIPQMLRQLGLVPGSWLPFILYFSLVNPWLEEIYWRGWLGSQAHHPILDDLWFGAYHLLILAPFVGWPWLLLALVTLAGAAWSWRQMARITGSLFAPGLAHLLADFSILMAIYLRTN